MNNACVSDAKSLCRGGPLCSPARFDNRWLVFGNIFDALARRMHRVRAEVAGRYVKSR